MFSSQNPHSVTQILVLKLNLGVELFAVKPEGYFVITT